MLIAVPFRAILQDPGATESYRGEWSSEASRLPRISPTAKVGLN